MTKLEPAPRAKALMAARQRPKLSPAAGWRDVIHLDRGHTGFVTPDHIREAAVQAIRDGHTHYEDVLPLREAIAEKLEADNGIKVDPVGEVVIGAGAHLVLFDIMQTFVAPGDEIIVPRPGSPTYYYFNAVLNGGTPVFVPLRPERRFKLDPEDVAAAITPRTRVIGLTSPDTPTGAVQERADLERIAELAIRHDLLVVADELYEKINFGRRPHVSIASLPGMRERTITVNGFSKAYAMTGWRVGYAAGPEALIQPVQAMHATNCIWLSTPSQYAALAALRGPQAPLAAMIAEYERRMHILVEGLNAIEGISCQMPEAAYYGWPDISWFGLPSQAFAQYVLDHGQVLVGPGPAFGPAAGEGYLRVSCSPTEADLREGLRRLALACAQLVAEPQGA